MSVTTTTFTQRPIEGQVSIWFAAMAQRFASWSSRRRTMRALSGLTDRELADIGLTRGEIAYVARQVS